MIKKARQYAIDAHKQQMYGTKPYVYHLDKVVSHLKEYDEYISAMGYLHDVVEDTEISVEDIESEFGSLIAKGVALLSDEPGKTRYERKKKTYAKMALVSEDSDEYGALIVKTADRLANLQECVATDNHRKLRMYLNEHPDFSQSVYRFGLCEELWESLNALIEHAEKKYDTEDLVPVQSFLNMFTVV